MDAGEAGPSPPASAEAGGAAYRQSAVRPSGLLFPIMLPSFLRSTTEEASGVNEQERCHAANAEQIRRVREALAARNPPPQQGQQRSMRRPQDARGPSTK